MINQVKYIRKEECFSSNLELNFFIFQKILKVIIVFFRSAISLHAFHRTAVRRSRYAKKGLSNIKLLFNFLINFI